MSTVRGTVCLPSDLKSKKGVFSYNPFLLSGLRLFQRCISQISIANADRLRALGPRPDAPVATSPKILTQYRHRSRFSAASSAFGWE